MSQAHYVDCLGVFKKWHYVDLKDWCITIILLRDLNKEQMIPVVKDWKGVWGVKTFSFGAVSKGSYFSSHFEFCQGVV